MPETALTASRTFWSLGLIPAQSWIAEARRSRDLLAGSRLLAWAMGRLLALLRDRGATIRLPELDEQALQSLSGNFQEALRAGTTGVSNHASGWISRPLSDANTLFGELDQHLARLWNDLQEEVTRESRRSASNLWAIAGPEIGQPPCPLQVVWALQESAAGDDRGLEEVDALYAAVKRSRPIPVHVGGAPVRKCGQCGRREAIGGADPVTWHSFQDRLWSLKEVKQGLRIEANEYLCRICGLRRCAGYLREDRFPSTSEIAASDWLWRIRTEKDLRAALGVLEAAARSVPGYDKEWVDRAPLLYRRSLDRELRQARKSNDEDLERALTDVQQKRRHLEDAIRRHNEKHPKSDFTEAPSDYLAVVMFDGDDMGRKLREDLRILPGKVVEFQRQLDERFKKKEGEGGLAEPFYLGGDEGLLLAPVGVVLDLADEIRRIWNETAGSTAARATLSMGIALFDRERPLGAAIETARRSLERAKQVPKKNALAVSVQTASGSEWTSVARWGESWNRISAAVERIRSGVMASGWPHDVERFLRSVPGEAFRGDDDSRSAIREEVKRITIRRSDDEALAWERLGGETWWSEQPADEELATLADQFHLVAFFARQSGPSLNEPKVT